MIRWCVNIVKVDAFRAGPILPVKVGTICCKVKTTSNNFHYYGNKVKIDYAFMATVLDKYFSFKTVVNLRLLQLF